MRLSQLERMWRETSCRATPQRNPDFRYLRVRCGQDDPEVEARTFTIERRATGYPGLLYRYVFAMPNHISFACDLLPEHVVPIVQRLPLGLRRDEVRRRQREGPDAP